MKSNRFTSYFLKLLAALAIVYGMLIGAMVIFQDSLVFVPGPGDDTMPQDVGLEGDEVWFETEDGIELHGWFIPVEEAEYAVLFSHGNAGNLQRRSALVRMLSEAGASVFIYDYRGYGHSEGSPSEGGLYKDLEAAIQYLLMYGYKEGQIVLYGRSLGGSVAAYGATQIQAAGLILDSAFTDLETMVRDVYPFVPPSLAKYDFPTIQYLDQMNSMPVLIFHSPEDNLVQFHHGEKLYDKSPSPKTFVELRGGHNNNYRISEDLFAESLRYFLQGLE